MKNVDCKYLQHVQLTFIPPQISIFTAFNRFRYLFSVDELIDAAFRIAPSLGNEHANEQPTPYS